MENRDFIYNGSTFTTLDVLGTPQGISGNSVVGSYNDQFGATQTSSATL